MSGPPIPIENQVNVCVALECPTINNILLVKNRFRGWEIPGGKAEQSDTPEGATRGSVIDVIECAKREVEEETGIDLDNLLLDNKIEGNGILYGNHTIVLRFNCRCNRTNIDHVKRYGAYATRDNSIIDVKCFNKNSLPKLSYPDDHIFRVI